jgi:predicted YcjX-like family ATPase
VRKILKLAIIDDNEILVKQLIEIIHLIDILNELLKENNIFVDLEKKLNNILDNFFFNKTNIGYKYIFECI